MASETSVKEYIVKLTKNDSNQMVMRFVLDDKLYDLNFESDDSTQIKNVFSKLLEKLVHNPVHLRYKKDESLEGQIDLFDETTQEYVNQLNTELDQLENTDDDLKKIREIYSVLDSSKTSN